MTTGNTSLLKIALPVEGELDGTWGTVVNNSITSLVDSAVAGTTTLAFDVDVVLTDTANAANQSRQAILLWTASGSTLRTIEAPARSKPYIVINKTGGTQSIKLVGAGPTTGVTVVAGEKCVVAWDGSDFVKISSSVADGVTSVSGTGTVNGISLSGTVTSTGNLTLGGALSGVSLTSQVTGTLPVANGGTGTTTPNLVAGSNVTITGTWPNQTINASASGGTVTSVSGTGTVNGITLSGTVTSSGSLTLGGALTGVNLTSQVTGTLPVANGGTGVTTSTGTGSVVLSTSPTLITPALGTPSSATLTNATGLPIDAGTTGTLPVSRGGTGVTSSTGSGSVVLSTSPTLTTPVLGTPTSGTLSNCTVDGTNAIGYRSIPPVGTKTTSYTLTTADVGKYVQVGSGGSITIPDATFAEGNAVSIFNNTSGNITITCSITTAYIAGTDSDKATMTLATRGVATILFISSTICVVSGNVS